MKTRLALLVLAAAPLCAHAWDAAVVREDLEFLSTTYPRLEGSHQEKRAAEYILRRLEDLGANHYSLQFDDAAPAHSYSTVIRATIPGETSWPISIPSTNTTATTPITVIAQ